MMRLSADGEKWQQRKDEKDKIERRRAISSAAAMIDGQNIFTT
jgi:hypothetical protein